MMPAFRPGDHVLTFNWGRIDLGDVVVFNLEGKNLIKRVDKIVDNCLYISGDNKKQSSKMEPVKKDQIVGKVILKY